MPAVKGHPHPGELPNATTMYRVAGRTYPMKVVKDCRVCNSPWRTAVENFIIMGVSYNVAARELPEEARISADSIRHHFNQNHLPLIEEAKRRLIERRAVELNFDVDTAVDRLDDHVTFGRSLVHDVFVRMQTREIQPDIKDAIAMARVLAQIDIDKETEDNIGMFVQGIRLVLEKCRMYMTPDNFARFSQEVLEDPIIQSIASNMPEHRAPQSPQLALQAGEGIA